MANEPPRQSKAPATRRQRDHRDRPHQKPSAKVAQKQRPAAVRAGPAGLEVRALAVRLVAAVLDRHRSLDDVLAVELAAEHAGGMAARDKGLARLIAATVLRRRGELEAAIATFIERPLPDDRGRLSSILLVAAAQLLVLDVAPHAAINIAVEQCRHDQKAGRFAKLANAVLRRLSEGGPALLAAQGGARANIPFWLWARWVATYGDATADAIASASLREAALDITTRAGREDWAALLGGVLLPTGTIRIAGGAHVEELAGFADGAWWVQDAAAALPALLFGEIAGQHIADLCAAPGGKTAQLAARGAHVIAVDSSALRLARVRQNLKRLKLEAEVIEADATVWTPDQPLDGVLVDAPCTATGTIRRHPDILHLKRESDIAKLAAVQARLIEHAFAMLRPGGLLVYGTCSLEPEEGEQQINRFLARESGARRVPIKSAEFGGMPEWITPDGDLRTLPCHLPHDDPQRAGMDGFYAARLQRLG